MQGGLSRAIARSGDLDYKEEASKLLESTDDDASKTLARQKESRREKRLRI